MPAPALTHREIVELVEPFARRGRSVAGDITLTPAHGSRFDLPENLLAVQGWDWARVLRNREG